MNYIKTALLGLLIACITICSACNKNKFLSDKTISKLFIPSTLEDVQSLLDNDLVINTAGTANDISADNYYISWSTWQGLPQIDQNTYIWAADIYNGAGNITEWNLPYQQVYFANQSLDVLKNISPSESQARWSVMKGMALFIRGFAFFNVAQLFAPPFDSVTADSDLGIPLRLTASMHEVSHRSTVKETYRQILSDLQEAAACLPSSTDPQHPNRASKPAAFALLSRVYLSMRNYKMAGAYADSCLQLYNKLLDYNNVPEASRFPFDIFNPEILYETKAADVNILTAIISRTTIIDSVLYQSYSVNDIRHSVFYGINTDGLPVIRSSYSGNVFPFQGLATDEVYLTRAECYARNGNIASALNDLNILLKNRWKKGSFTQAVATTTSQALQLILTERRKELPFRGIRWMDLRRLNKEGAQIKIQRELNGTTYEMLPNSLRYVFPIPPDVIALSGMPQNSR